MTPRSLSLRLVAGAGLGLALALSLTGMLLAGLFRSHVEAAFERDLKERLAELAAESDIGADGEFEIIRPPNDPRYGRARSGAYWQVTAPDGTILRSPSLAGFDLAVPPLGAADGIRSMDGHGPAGEHLRLVARALPLGGSSRPALIAVAADSGDITAATRQFTWLLMLALSALGLGLIGAVILQIRYGLAPLRAMAERLGEIRSGKLERMDGEFPSEVQPFAEEINALIEQNSQTIARARSHAGNLAHALKTPLAVMRNEAGLLGGEAGGRLTRQIDIMNRNVGHHLARARSIGVSARSNLRCDAGLVLGDLARTMGTIHRDRALAIEIDQATSSTILFRGERQDLEEMAGNLLDNACKWAKRRIRVELREVGRRLRVSVEDDGPGIAEQAREAATRRGHRLDEAVAGSGLGLAIVTDLAELYGGSLQLSVSTLGGLAARLDLPAGEG